MRTFDEAYAAAHARRAFSNGTEGYAWIDNWCSECIHDAPYQRDEATEGCPLLMVSMLDRTPVEWIDQTLNGAHMLGDTYHCTEYREEDEGGGDESSPEPPPAPFVEEMPGQVDIFEVFADDVVERLQTAEVNTRVNTRVGIV